MTLEGKRALVTGAGGFIASHLVESLVRAGVCTRGLVHYNSRGDEGQLAWLDPGIRRQLEVLPGDVRDRWCVRQAVEGCDLVFHLAALIGIPYSYRAPQSYVETNVLGTLNVLEACRDCRVGRLLCTSTSEVYGTARYTPIDEDHPLQAQSPYAATKIAADQLARSYHASFGLPVVIVRPFNTFGPRQSARAVIPTILAQALAGDRLALGSTSPVRDFLFVADNVRGFLAAAEAPGVEGEVLNLATGAGVTIGQVVELAGKLLGRTLQVQTDLKRRRPDKSEVLELIGSAAKAAQQTGWRAAVGLEEGLAATLAWIRDHRHLYRPDSYMI
jgi:dTDP-glucose 4,6-dehydratase